MATEERRLQYAYQRVKEKHGDEIKELLGLDLTVPKVPFPRIPMAKAVRNSAKTWATSCRLRRRAISTPAVSAPWPNGSRQNTTTILSSSPIGRSPCARSITCATPTSPNLTRSFDLIANGLEITTGAQREHRSEILAKQALEKGLTLEPIQFYLDFFRFGCPPHGGFGLGLSRLLMVMLGLQNIREAVYLFRGPNRLNP